MQTQIEKALNDIARELHGIRKLMEEQIKIEKYKTGMTTPMDLPNKPWAPFEAYMDCDNQKIKVDFDCLSNNPEAHGWCQDEQG